jgi:hypothetical protein
VGVCKSARQLHETRTGEPCAREWLHAVVSAQPEGVPGVRGPVSTFFEGVSTFWGDTLSASCKCAYASSDLLSSDLLSLRLITSFSSIEEMYRWGACRRKCQLVRFTLSEKIPHALLPLDICSPALSLPRVFATASYHVQDRDHHSGLESAKQAAPSLCQLSMA